jgi:hypothetical protein
MEQAAFGISRRTFVKLAGATGVGLSLPERARAGEPQEIENKVEIQTPVLHITFNASTGVPTRYLLKKDNVDLMGDDAGAPIEVRVCRKQPWSCDTLRSRVISVHPQSTEMVFRVTAGFGGVDAVEFSLRYVAAGSRMTASLEHVDEKTGFELLEVRLPALVTVRRDREGAWMAHGDTGGALIEVATAKPGSLAPNQFWGDTLSTLPVLMAGDSKAFCVLVNQSFMDGGAMSVSSDGRGAMGTVQRHRVDGSQCADLNLGKDQPLNCGNAGTPNLLVKQQPTCQLDFFPASGDWKQLWLVGAHHVRKQLPPKRTAMYDDVFTYGIRLDEPTWPQPATTFSQCEEIIREVAALTANTAQIVHLWGWQFKGKDTGYPAVNEVDARIGGYEGMMHLMENARKYNARVTLSDNYDDGYRSSPKWSEEIVARRPDGELYNSRSWTGENSYILGLAKYVRHGALERVDYTCKRYKLPGTTHIDVLTYYAIRNDWDRRFPASGYANLVEGKYKILDAFHERGIDVSSEAPRYPFMGKVSFFWQGCGIRPCPMGGRPIPMFPAVYRQVAVWGDGMRRGELHPGAAQMFYGGGPRFMTRHDEDRAVVAETFYLQAVPWMLLHRRNILSFIDNEDEARIGIEDGEIRVSLRTGKYSATLNGTQVATESWVACPVGSDRIVFYSIDARTLRFPVPSGWDVQNMKAATATKEGPRPIKLQVHQGDIIVDVTARNAVFISRA